MMMKVSPRPAFALLWLCLAAAAARAQPSSGQFDARPPDKSVYHLFNPTPRHLMREMATDRPDITESPYTVDAGHFQAELSFLEYTRDDVPVPEGEGNVDAEHMAILPANLKVGLLNNVDLQLVLVPYLRSEVGGADAWGLGDFQIRLKVNLWGNDADLYGPHRTFGNSALAIMPFIELPTGDDDLGLGDDIEGGVIIPFAMPLPHGFSLGLMAEFDFVKDDDGDGYDLEFVHTASIGHDLVGDLAGYVEYVGIAAPGDYLAHLGAGLTYGLTPDVQLDAGVLVGLEEDAEDFTVFAGVSFRI